FAAMTQVGRDLVWAGLQTCGVNLRRSTGPRSLHPCAAPVVFDGTFGIEIRSISSCRDRLAGKDFGGLYRAGCPGWSLRPLTAEHKHNAGLQSCAAEIGGRGRARWTKPVARPYIVCPEEAQSKVTGHVD